MASPLLRVGLSKGTGRMPIEMEIRGIPALISANSFFDHSKRQFRAVPVNLMDLDVALDSAGFVAMARYGRYPWSIAQYIEFALANGFTWFSQMDCCVEPEVAADRDTVVGRIHATSQMLQLCREECDKWLSNCPELACLATEPMPILQGWMPDDYKLSAELTDRVLGGIWPDMIGIGSVCRRQLNGPTGLWRVLHEIDRVLPPATKLHLFGVKGAAMRGLADHPRVVSVDSMSFELQARIDCRKRGVSKTIGVRVKAMETWIARQFCSVNASGPAQQDFEFAATS